jgi:hypothetical protein
MGSWFLVILASDVAEFMLPEFAASGGRALRLKTANSA